MASRIEPAPGGRGRGRPVGSDSAETRATILRAARTVIVERGYEAATFQAIAARAGFSRPTMHYYFHTKEEIYESLQREAYSVVSDCIAAAKRQDTLLDQLSTFVAAARRLDFSDGSMMRFIVMSRLEQHRHPRLRGSTTAVTEAVAGFYRWMVDDAIRRGEISAHVDADAVANMLFAMFWGMGLFAGFIHGATGVSGIAKQLNTLLRRGLLSAPVDADLAVMGAPAVMPVDPLGGPGYRETPDSSAPVGAIAFGA
ncbi:DNA-binding transcriptional regulator, AcrR family [Mycolicibacterium rutilum]|uniref:DNA-binding transcriptional regulator, AcrR family n=1 Tax=Mycolicibacterium rutilum TaxID=370526 RepID=A0A1H6KYK9_MYCRU|nr:TetR/AcrR family transcriptional regulator [Mycolicibacterium rutilum]SEH80945.1 DNA-binding transcriptional regulator, AcrR family [Mycolicibacterium rutilum]